MVRTIGLALACWATVFALLAIGAGDATAALTPGGVLLSALCALGPIMLALPAGRALLAPLWALEVILAWSCLGYLVVLFDPAALGRGMAFALLLPVLFGALASPGLLIAAWITPARAAIVRRQAYLLAALPVGLVLLRGLNALSPLTTALFILLFLMAQMLFVSGLRRAEAADADAPAEAEAEAAPVPTPAPAPAAPEPPRQLRPVIAIAARTPLD